MNQNLITRYLEYKKKCLISYVLSLFIDQEYQQFEIECLKKYINNYVEVYYHKNFETLGSGVVLDRNAIEIEQEGMRLELLDNLQAKEIIESNISYNRKKEIIEKAKEYTSAVITFDQKKTTTENLEETIINITTALSKRLPVLQNATTTWTKKAREDQKVIAKLLEEKKNFVLNQIPYQEGLWELSLLTRVKQMNMYKKSLVKRVESEKKVEKEKIKIIIMITSQIILGQLVRKETIGNYMIFIPEEVWQEKEIVEELFHLLNDNILKEHVYLGISYNIINQSKRLQAKKKEGYHFVCYQDFTHILDISSKIDSLDTSNLFDYLMVTNYKEKDITNIEKEETSIIKKIFFRKVG